QSRTSGLANSIRSFLNAGGTCSNPGGGTSSTSATPTSTTASKTTSTAPGSTSTTATTTTASPTSTSTPSNCPREDPAEVSKITKPSLRPKPVKAAGNAPARVEFIASHINDNKYTTVIKIQSAQGAFSANWSLTFNLPAGQTVDASSRGSVAVNGDKVTIRSIASNEKPKNMAATFKVSGTFTGEYKLPDTSSASFNSA
ncbi:hypothetical protein GGI12_005957, partial [Dipsacomyces acuminosporus]